ncbi:hypothetical protein [Legionella fallonii]|uniref:Uncharacterized protein n=1 Tax=Legionella fallonii LLAP-10 TaxID=1212491 RepID=A0A098G9T3_9GAMM|nr:hypothetical protein [Legionella fallonii]CEG58747.1 exported protein of unknown function [Legionella fallonii LLAP-10]
MNPFKSCISRSVLLSLFTLVTTSAHSGISVIISTPPPPREIVVGPPGYTNCYMVQPGFYNGVWQHKHRVCEYEGNSGLRMWVTGYWQCGRYLPNGRCTGWHWIGSHWATRPEVAFYSRPSHRDYYRHLAYGRGHEHGHRYRHEESYRGEHRHGYH